MVVKAVLWPTASPPTGNLLKAQILQPNPRPTESKTLGVGPSNLVKKPTRWFWHILKLENHCSGVMILDSKLLMPKKVPKPSNGYFVSVDSHSWASILYEGIGKNDNNNKKQEEL